MKICQHCSKILSKSTKGTHCIECFKKFILIPRNKLGIGKTISPEVREKIAAKQRGEKSHNWKGDKVGYKSLHEWVRKYLPKPKFCEGCGKVPPYDLANKGVYNRDFSNWEYLCRKCHIVGDGRVKRLGEARDKYFASKH